MSLAVGEKIGSYDILDVVKGARIGVSYKVRNTLADRVEVLRVLPKDVQGDREQSDRFLREIKVHSRLTHPNIVTFYHAGLIDGQMIMTTEMTPGITLEQRIDQGPVPREEAIRLIRQALAALACAHELGVVHREISPANMILTPDGMLKLTGFGLAKSAADKNLTQVGTVMGWVEYMAPEQVQGVQSPDARTDLYAVGVLLYELLTGRLPFIRDTQFDVMLAHLTALPRPPVELKPDLSPELSAVILTALEKDPLQRYQSAQAFSDALEAAAAGRAPAPSFTLKPVVDRAPILPAPPEEAPIWTSPKLWAAGVATFILTMLAFFAAMRAF